MANSACAVSEFNDVTTGYLLQRRHSTLYQWISRGFTLARYLGKGSVPSIYEKLKDSLDTDHPRDEERLGNLLFPRNLLWMFLWNPTVKHQYPKSPPPEKKIDFFSDWVGLFEV